MTEIDCTAAEFPGTREFCSVCDCGNVMCIGDDDPSPRRKGVPRKAMRFQASKLRYTGPIGALRKAQHVWRRFDSCGNRHRQDHEGN